ncbi:hypothetical protein [Lysobacter sp. D1-1-M9]|uniref:hypothetical protein n=1 Tax=Novilysobacter longmucuonensis TaxID=3098603 RepID=UPI002FC7D497
MAAVTESAIASPAAKRASWGAILAGVVIALAVHVLMGVLGIAIGASVIDPMSEANPVEGIGIGSGIYFVITVIVAMLAGGCVAGALAVIQTRRDRTLHGLAMWSVVTLLTVMLLATGLGRLIGGTMNIVGQGLSQAGDAASALAEPVAGEVQEQMQEADLDIDALRQEAAELLRDAGIRPGDIEEDTEQVRAQAGQALERAARDPQAADQAFQQVFDRIQQSARETMDDVDRDALVNLVVERTDMSRAEAQQTVANWERSYAQAYQQSRATWEQAKARAEQKAREWGQQSAEAVASAAWWSFLVLVLGAIAAAIGANLGSSRMVVATRADVHR